MTASGRNPRLSDLSRACDPNEPADVGFFTPLNEARGSGLFADVVLQDLRETNGKRKWLFSGHVGCGKSSELLEVARVVSNPETDGERFLPIYVDIKPYLDLLYITPEAVQLAIVAELADTFRAKLGIRLDAGYFMDLFKDILNLLRTPAESSEIEAGIAGFKAKFKYAYKSPSGRDKVQAMLRPRTADLLTALNDLFTDATSKLKAHSIGRDERPYDDFLVIVDTLDRVLKVPDADMGFASHKRLFLDDAPQFTGLDAFIVYTVPLPLARGYAPALTDLYGSEPYVLPMVKVCTREEKGPYAPGYEALRKMLRKRLGGQDPKELIGDDAFEYLVANTGGYVREFVAGVGKCARTAQGKTITLTEAEIVIADNYANYENGIKKAWLPEMIALQKDALRRIDLTDENVHDMLEYHFVLEYRNGLEDADRVQRNTIWYALHPLVRESEYLQKVMADAERLEAKPSPTLTVETAS